jgi:hypothetical protein
MRILTLSIVSIAVIMLPRFAAAFTPVTQVPEPTTLLFVGLGLGGLALYRGQSKK